MSLGVRLLTTNPDLRLGLVEAFRVRVEDAPAALDRAVLEAARAAKEEPPGESRRRAVRDLLRHGGFKPTGRSKPASEYLAGAAMGDVFPRVNGVVDAANLVSLASGIPVSIVDRERALGGGDALEVREGHPGEAYVFNAAGHVIDVEGLLGVARPGGALFANPVKDAMETKVDVRTTAVVAFLYATRVVWDGEDVRRRGEALAQLLVAHAGAADAHVHVYERAPA